MSTRIFKPLPAAIEQKLAAVRRRAVLLAAMRGLAIAGSVLLATMIAAMSIDWLATLFDPVARLTLTVSTFLAAGVTLILAAAGPIRRALRRSYAARLVDAAVPQLQQRWSTVAGLADSAPPTSPVAQSMLEQVASEAVAMQSLVHPSRIISFVALRPAALTLLGSLLAMAIFLGIRWEQTSILLQRFLSPTQNITATELTSVTGSLLVPRGEMIELLASQSGLKRSTAELTVELPAGVSEVLRVPAQADDPNTFVRFIRADKSLHYRFRAGDGQTQWHSVQVIDYPEIAEVRFTLTAPDYVNRAVVTKDLIPRQVKVIQGTQLALSIKPKDPIEKLVMTLATLDPANSKREPAVREVELVADADGWYQFQTSLIDNVTLRPALLSKHGLSDKGRSFCKVQVIADQAPVARIVRPTDELAVALDDVLQIEFEAHDDHGIATAELVIYDDSATEDGEPKVLATRLIPLGEQSLQKHLTGSVQLDLKELALDSGRSISYAVRVTDNRQAVGTPLNLKSPAAHETGLQDHPVSEDAPSADGGAQAVDDPAVAREFGLDRTQSEQGLERLTANPLSKVPVAVEDSPSVDGSASEHLEKPTSNDEVRDSDSQALSAVSSVSDRSRSNTSQSDASDAAASEVAKSSEPKLDTAAENSSVADGVEDDSDESSTARSIAGVKGPAADAILQPQQGESGQNVESNRRRLKITERLASIKYSDAPVNQTGEIRSRVVAVDAMLEETEKALKALVGHQVADAQRSEEFANLDARFGGIEKHAAELRAETKDTESAFAGLQLIDIIRTHVTPARDRVFAAIRNPNVSDVDAKVALGHVLRARELLAALLKRFDRVRRDRELSEALEESITMYEIYVEKRLALMREARENRNPLARKMAVLEVDQAYLDRYAEVERLRQQMMEEFARLLGDDPRLLSRYLELVRRRARSMRDRLSVLAERQQDAEMELSGWLQIDEEQQDALWTMIQEMRLPSVTQLAKDTAELAERIEKQMPLTVDTGVGTPAAIIRIAQGIAQQARTIGIDAERVLGNNSSEDLAAHVQPSAGLIAMFTQLDAAFDYLQFEHEGDLEFTDFIQPRLQESRVVADQAEAWAMLAGYLTRRSYNSIVAMEQQRLAAETQLLRTDMLSIEDDLNRQFQQQVMESLPSEIAELIRQLHRLMESVTFNQAAASYAASSQDLLRTAQQQQLAMDGLGQAEELLDRIRRSVADALDAYPTQSPNIADLRDPTLDEFLARLEREPSIAAQLGIPERPRNLRNNADSMLWQETGQGLLGESAEAAMTRVKQAMRREGSEGSAEAKQRPEASAEERQAIAEAKEAQEMLENALLTIEQQMESKETSPQQREQLRKLAADLKEILRQADEDSTAKQAWKQISQTDTVKAILVALQRGEPVPDHQWNKLLSTLEDGLWQGRGKRPPEEYRKAIEQYQDRIRELAGPGHET